MRAKSIPLNTRPYKQPNLLYDTPSDIRQLIESLCPDQTLHSLLQVYTQSYLDTKTIFIKEAIINLIKEGCPLSSYTFPESPDIQSIIKQRHQQDLELIQAVKQKNIATITNLLTGSIKPYPMAHDRFDYTALLYAIEEGDFQIVSLLLRYSHIDINENGERGFTPLHLAAFWGQTMIANLLIHTYNADPNICSLTGETPYQWARINQQVSTAHFLSNS